MPPSDGMEDTGAQRKTHKMPVDKIPIDVAAIDESSFAKAMEEMSLELEVRPVDKTLVHKESQISQMVIGDMMPMAAKGVGPKRIKLNNNPKPPSGFMQLPYKIRKQIRYEALLMDEDRGKPFLTSSLAEVSREWRDDIEEVLFNDITINTLDHQEVSMFNEMFSTDKRRSLLKRLNIVIEDSETGPWRPQQDPVKISQFLTSIGNFLGYINGWDFHTDGGGRCPLEIVFATSQFPDAGIDWSRGQRLIPNTTSLWEERESLVDADQFDRYSPLWEIDSKFPSSLDMVTHLSIPPDCVAGHVAAELIETMPNLETLVLDPRFDIRSGRAWNELAITFEVARYSTPCLQSLTLRNTAYVPDRRLLGTGGVSPHESALFAADLRTLSQDLRSLCANPFELDAEFIRPFALKKHHVYRYTFSWPKLQHIDLQFFDGFDYNYDEQDETERRAKLWDTYKYEEARQPDHDNDGEENILNQKVTDLPRETSSFLLPRNWEDMEPELELEEILIAAGRATAAMPVLESAHISVWSQPRGSRGIFAKRKLCPKSGSTMSSRYWLSDDFHPKARPYIMVAWANFLGPDPKIDEGLQSEFPDVQRASSPTR